MSKPQPKTPGKEHPKPNLPGPYPPSYSPDEDDLPTRMPPSPPTPKGF